MLIADYAGRFKKDYKLALKRNLDISLLPLYPGKTTASRTAT